MRMTLFRLFAVCLLSLSFALPAAAREARMEGIAAVVNADAVSASDLEDRMRLVMISSGMPDNQDIRERLKPQILSVLIDEKLKLQEAARLEIAVTPEDVAQGFASLAGQNNFTPDQFRAVLTKEGLSVKTLEDQIQSQIAWSKVIQNLLQPQVTVTDNEVDAVIARLKADEGKAEYQVSEIFLPVDSPEGETDVRNLADKLIRQIMDNHAPFGRVAEQFSQSPGAARGGDMGWVQQGQLAQELDSALAQMNEGEVSKPVRSLAGYHVLLLRKKRTMTADTIPSPDAIMQRLGMERLERAQRRHLLDLKSGAFIEQRV